MIKVRGLAYVLFNVTDLDVARTFLTDFGLEVSDRSSDRIAFGTADGNPYAYVACKGEQSGFLGLGFEASSENDLDALVSAGLGKRRRPLLPDFNGRRVTVENPAGYRIDVVHGRDWLARWPVRDPLTHNYGTRKQRINHSQRPPKGRVHALRLGHIALRVPDVNASVEWFGSHFGLKAADVLVTPDEEERTVGVFMSCDPMQEITDHHSVFVTQSDNPGLHHVAFEVQDIDAVMSGHDFLIDRGYKMEVGVGRHMAGSQVFDYWIDPFGSRIEHYADGDVVDARHAPSRIPATPEGVTQWGPIPPEKFFQ